MKNSELIGALTFLKSAERLKDVLRSAHTSSGRHESTAEHTWRLCLWVMVFADKLDNIDIAKLLKICVIHDLGEALSGDIPAIEQVEDGSKSAQERADIMTLVEPLAPKLQTEIIALWEEYENAASTEARLAKGFDKLETILQHNQGLNAPDFDYAFNLSYGSGQTSIDPLLAQIREILDTETKARVQKTQITACASTSGNLGS